jgi:hypothetical protein
MKKITKIGKPCSPSKHISDELIQATEVLASWGGGMGGASKKYYFTNNNGNSWTDLVGEEMFINPEFIVHKRKVRIVKTVTDTTGHSNYHQPTCKYSETTRHILLPYGYDYRCIMDYTGQTNGIILTTNIKR